MPEVYRRKPPLTGRSTGELYVKLRQRAQGRWWRDNPTGTKTLREFDNHLVARVDVAAALFHPEWSVGVVVWTGCTDTV